MDKTAGRVVIVCAVAAAFALILIHYTTVEGGLNLDCLRWQYPDSVHACRITQLQTALYGVVVLSAAIAAWVVNARRA